MANLDITPFAEMLKRKREMRVCFSELLLVFVPAKYKMALQFVLWAKLQQCLPTNNLQQLQEATPCLFSSINAV